MRLGPGEGKFLNNSRLSLEFNAIYDLNCSLALRNRLNKDWLICLSHKFVGIYSVIRFALFLHLIDNFLDLRLFLAGFVREKEWSTINVGILTEREPTFWPCVMNDPKIK